MITNPKGINCKNGKDIKCLMCGKGFYVPKSRLAKKKFCSRSCDSLFRVGKMPKNTRGLKLGHGWNRGLKRWWNNPASFKKGHKPPWTGKKRPNMTGENNPHWKGGYYNSETAKLRHSLEYKLWRDAVYQRDNYTCVWCGQRGGKLEGDHIQTWIERPDLRFAIDNGRTLCVGCHKKRHSLGSKPTCKRALDIGI